MRYLYFPAVMAGRKVKMLSKRGDGMMVFEPSLPKIAPGAQPFEDTKQLLEDKIQAEPQMDTINGKFANLFEAVPQPAR